MTEIEWNGASEADWRRTLEACGRSTVEQTWGHGVASAEIGFAVDRGIVVAADGPVGLVQAITKRFFGLATVTQIIRGPLWVEGGIGDAEKAQVLGHLRGRYTKGRLRFVYWVPEMADSPDARRMMRETGLRRVVTGYSSAWVDLAPDEDRILEKMSSQWRNMLRRGAEAQLSIRMSNGGRDLDLLLQNYDTERRQRRYRGPSGGFIKALVEGTGVRGDIVVASAYREKSFLAGVLVIRHGASATYQAGWTSTEGRDARAHNTLLWRCMQTLRKQGVRWLDVGGLDTTNAAGIARFKLGLGGEVFTLAGSYL